MGTIAAIIGAILLGLVGRWLAVEIAVWHRPFCNRLIKFAACQLPSDQRAAAECEWLAIIEDIRSPAAQLLHSASFVIKAGAIKEALALQSAAKSESKAARGFTIAFASSVAISSVGIITYIFPLVGVLIVYVAIAGATTVGLSFLYSMDGAKIISPDWRHPRCNRQRLFSAKKVKRRRNRRRHF